jgi:hypothetical protein
MTVAFHPGPNLSPGRDEWLDDWSR